MWGLFDIMSGIWEKYPESMGGTTNSSVEEVSLATRDAFLIRMYATVAKSLSE